MFWNAAGSDCRVVFGTLLGPEATGLSGWVVAFWVAVCFVGTCLFLVSWLHRSHGFACPFGAGGVWGVWYGVVV